MRGLIHYDFAKEYYAAFLRDVRGWVLEGRIKYREEIVDGLKNARRAFIAMLSGQNFGKLLIHAGAEE